jgi:hypothetical protein
VADQLGPEIPPGSPEYIWVSSIISAVEKRTGTSSRWNGRLYEEPNPAYLGSAHHDGSMTVSPKNVLEPVRDAYTGRPMKANDYIRVRDAVLTVTHEAAHLTSHLGDPAGPGAHPVGDPADRALEEGLAESWTHRNVDAVIYDIGMDRSVPGVIGPPNVDAYKAYSAATNSLAQGLGTVAGVPPDEVRRQLHGADRAQRWNKVADLMIDRRLGGLMPPEHRDVVRQNLVQPLRTEFAKLPAVQQDAGLDGAAKAQAGRRTGQDAVSGLNTTLNHAETHYRSWYQQQAATAARQQTHQAVQQQPNQQVAAQQAGFQQAALQHPGPQQSQPFWNQPTAQTPQAASHHPPAQTGQPPAHQRTTPATSPDLDKLRKFLGAQEPASKVVTRPTAASTATVPATTRTDRTRPEHGQSVD